MPETVMSKSRDMLETTKSASRDMLYATKSKSHDMLERMKLKEWRKSSRGVFMFMSHDQDFQERAEDQSFGCADLNGRNADEDYDLAT